VDGPLPLLARQVGFAVLWSCFFFVALLLLLSMWILIGVGAAIATYHPYYL
jgi:hypothetical protein